MVLLSFHVFYSFTISDGSKGVNVLIYWSMQGHKYTAAFNYSFTDKHLNQCSTCYSETVKLRAQDNRSAIND